MKIKIYYMLTYFEILLYYSILINMFFKILLKFNKISVVVSSIINLDKI